MSADRILLQSKLEQYRERAYRYPLRLRVRTIEQAVAFANERGFLFFWPNKGYELPSMWCAVAGNRPVPNNHDDPAQITWSWKDSLLGKKRWYYARVLCRRNTLISLEMLPYFYALSPNYGTPDEDYLIEYQQGKLTQEEKAVFETLLDQGALNTLALRKEARLSSSENTTRFSRALDNLQRDFRVLPVGIAEAGAWHYAFIYDAFHRVFPEVIEAAHAITKSQAMRSILDAYFRSVGAAHFNEIKKIFHWPEADIRRILAGMSADGVILERVLLENQSREVFCLSTFFQQGNKIRFFSPL